MILTRDLAIQCPRYDLSVDYVNRLTFSEGLECGQHFLIEDCKGLLGAVTDMRRREYLVLRACLR